MEIAKRAWRYWLGKRHRGGYIPWKDFDKTLAVFPLPQPRIRSQHLIDSLQGSKVMRQKCAYLLITEEPYEGNLYVRLCGGGRVIC